MRSFQGITDPREATPPATRLDFFFLSLMRDPRDLPFVHLTLKICLTIVPLGILLFMPWLTGLAWWGVALLYFYLNNLVFKGPFGLMLHCTSHRPWFKKEYDWLNYFLPWIVSPFFGQTPETYFGHHIGMHHPENNLDEDKSTTMYYQRDSFRGFLKYFGLFMAVGFVDLFSYLKAKNRSRLAYKALAGELSFFLLCIGLAFVSLKATIVVFLLPFFIFRFIAMLGNWAQHAFVDARDPGNAYKNSVTCINVRYNHKCWNDGYHIGHHIRPALHWTQHPDFFLKHLDEYAENQALVFEGLDFGRIFILLMRKRYDTLASHLVNVHDAFENDEEVIALMKRRCQRIPRPEARELVH
ncbi:Fatty acid desaturase [Catalinimonas alkaloidigena]|uniref:Fatty acid desaturase n=1 Tax=Catalinimonas alkaloidigena TaxID=1075417 RepID=A0A1G9UML8_9BACT|nr:fatty acid desaturase [Catalinimonas alkaloidigena]SDM61190.1 Fatty acid desaturase [Catalinimonas alkaloidigena]